MFSNRLCPDSSTSGTSEIHEMRAKETKRQTNAILLWYFSKGGYIKQIFEAKRNRILGYFSLPTSKGCVCVYTKRLCQRWQVIFMVWTLFHTELVLCCCWNERYGDSLKSTVAFWMYVMSTFTSVARLFQFNLRKNCHSSLRIAHVDAHKPRRTHTHRCEQNANAT